MSGKVLASSIIFFFNFFPIQCIFYLFPPLLHFSVAWFCKMITYSCNIVWGKSWGNLIYSIEMNYEIVLFIMLNGGVPATFATHGMFIFKLLNKSVITNKKWTKKGLMWWCILTCSLQHIKLWMTVNMWKSYVHNCEDRFHIRFFNCSSHLYDIFTVIYSPLWGFIWINIITSFQLDC